MLTTFDRDEYVAALSAGASGFLLKDARPADIVAGIRVVSAGDALLAPSVTRRLLDRFATRREITGLAPPSGLNLLTDREREVMALGVRDRVPARGARIRARPGRGGPGLSLSGLSHTFVPSVDDTCGRRTSRCTGAV